MHRQVRFMARSAASYGVAVLHNLSPGKYLKQLSIFMDHVDKIDKMDFSVLRQKNKIVHQVHQVHQVHLKHRLHI